MQNHQPSEAAPTYRAGKAVGVPPSAASAHKSTTLVLSVVTPYGTFKASRTVPFEVCPEEYEAALRASLPKALTDTFGGVL